MSAPDDPPLPAKLVLKRSKRKPNAPPGAAFTAHMLEGGAVRRGLKGGSQTLDAAKTTYLQTEWSGGANRRARPGGKTSKAI